MHGRERLKAWMTEHGKRQQDVAAEIGTHQQNVSAWLRGRPVPLDMAVKLRSLTGIEVEAWVEAHKAAS